MNQLTENDPRFPYPIRIPHTVKPELFCLVHHFSVDRHERIRQYGLVIIREVGPETWVRFAGQPETKP
jgi:hypothetical protein